MLGQSTGFYQKVLKEVVNNQIAPLFQKNAFTGKGDSFFKVEPEIVKFVELEYFRFNTSGVFFYWFNFYLFYGDFNAVKRINLKLLLTRGTCVLKKRIGYLWDEEQHMYQISSMTDPNELAGRMKGDIANRLLPFYETFHNLDDVLKFLLNKNQQRGNNEYSFTMAILLAKTGKKEESKKFLLESTAPREIIEKTAKVYGIDLAEEKQISASGDCKAVERD